MTDRKNARKTAFVGSASDYDIVDGDFRVTINAKDFPEKDVFRVYRVYGDITKPDRLQAAIGNLLVERGVQSRKIEVSL